MISHIKPQDNLPIVRELCRIIRRSLTLAERGYQGFLGACSEYGYRLEPVIKTAKMIKRRLDNILIYLKHRIANAVPEVLNAFNSTPPRHHNIWATHSNPGCAKLTY